MADQWDDAAAQFQKSLDNQGPITPHDAKPRQDESWKVWNQNGDSGAHPMESIKHGISEFWDQVNPVNAVKGIDSAIRHPLETAKGMGQQNAALWDKARAAYDAGDYLGAVRHGINYALNGIPGMGASIDDAGDKFASGDIAGGTGESLGIGANLVAPAYAPKVARAVGGALKKAAAPMAESALGIKAMQRAYGKTPGTAILEETKGIRPSTVAESARAKLEALNTDLENRANSATGPASLQPARDVLAARRKTAAGGNSTFTPKEIAEMEDQLTKPEPGFRGTTQYPPGAATPIRVTQQMRGSQPIVSASGSPPEPVISADQSPAEILRMKREFGKDFTKWNPLHPKGEIGTARQAYRALDDELDRTVPGAEGLNQRISSLIPAAERAEETNLNAGIGQRVAHRVAAHTGALIGATAGYHAGGIPGGIAGLVVPELVSSPAARMAAARATHAAGRLAASPAAGRVAQAAAIAAILGRAPIPPSGLDGAPPVPGANDDDPLAINRYLK